MEKILFCPNPECDLHSKEEKDNNWYIKSGSYFTNAFGKIQRYRCIHCNKRFSDQTFHLDYYAKKKVNYLFVVFQIISKSGIRDMSRFMELSTGTITNRISRLCRQALALHSILQKELILKEDLVADGFESFCVSQYFPDNLNILVGQKSQYVYFNDYVTIRRKGRMTKYQKKRREMLEKVFKVDSQGIKKSFMKLLNKISELLDSSEKSDITLYTDKKLDYIQAVKNNKEIQKLKDESLFKHIRTSSKLERNLTNPLFPVNYIDREIRKGLANHVRETVQFSRNVNDGLSRLQIFFAYHNYWKDYRIKKCISLKHGEVAGIKREKIDEEKLTFFTERAFFTHLNIKSEMKKMWFRMFKTPLKESKEYVPKYAYT